MTKPPVGRREFLRGVAGSTAALSISPTPAARSGAQPPRRAVKFAVIGINHAHINSQVDAVLRGGGELVAVYAKEPDLLAAFAKRFPQAQGRAQREGDPRGPRRSSSC